jgi:hypothetical protein
MVRIRLIAKAKAQIHLFQEKTLKPSSIPKGIKLKKAIQALMAKLSKNTRLSVGTESAVNRKARDSVMFVAGPAMEIFPTLFLSKNPPIITAPGDIILKKGEIVESRVKAAPKNVSLNSAHNPFLCAANL